MRALLDCAELHRCANCFLAARARIVLRPTQCACVSYITHQHDCLLSPMCCATPWRVLYKLRIKPRSCQTNKRQDMRAAWASQIGSSGEEVGGVAMHFSVVRPRVHRGLLLLLISTSKTWGLHEHTIHEHTRTQWKFTCYTVVSNSSFITAIFLGSFLQLSIVTTSAICEQIFHEKLYILYHHDILVYYYTYLKMFSNFLWWC